ncbi:hypothetical protein D8I35_04070 [Corticibacter populi]|uniref:HemY N-terminal domain-containing protein n=1 Tax=Corticibacter populi TaxID=1550736 RepID=A0A3M6R082_9BURK|nr:heme biosynthesis HemY N-terminal domain-containing protein [Corticibacter populi]RMX08289.1 hypothetical protein D8I35_04070 [Corticibacter populi]RZS35569.1 HemY-like protein [Corticibacter populi]
MRSAIWLLILFCGAVAAALFLGDNRATVTLFWYPYRVDLSLNLLLLAWLALTVLVFLAMHTASKIWQMPLEARVWRRHQREVASYQALVRAMQHYTRGDYASAANEARSCLALVSSRSARRPGPGDPSAQEASRLAAQCEWLIHACEEAMARQGKRSLPAASETL